MFDAPSADRATIPTHPSFAVALTGFLATVALAVTFVLIIAAQL